MCLYACFMFHQQHQMHADDSEFVSLLWKYSLGYIISILFIICLLRYSFHTINGEKIHSACLLDLENEVNMKSQLPFNLGLHEISFIIIYLFYFILFSKFCFSFYWSWILCFMF